MPQKLKAIFFDVGNTLLFPNRTKILAPLYERKISPSPELLRALECRTKIEFDAIVERGPADHGFWFLFYSHLMDELGIEGDGLRDLLVENTRISANWCDVRPGTREVLQRLGKQYRLGVISNADGQIASVLKHCGIADCFQTITDSGLIGCEKPRAEIFHAALREMDVRPEDSLYVGDVYSVDYLGATRAGLQAILLDRKSTRLNSSHRCISYAVFCLKKKKKYLSVKPRARVQGDAYADDDVRNQSRALSGHGAPGETHARGKCWHNAVTVADRKQHQS